MSDPIQFFDSSDEPLRPLGEVRIRNVRVEVLSDGRRVAVSVDLTPFFEKPSFDVTLLRDGVEERSTSVVGAMHAQTQLTIHLPGGDPSGRYMARVDLLDKDSAVRQTESVSFEVPRPSSE